MRKKIGIGIGAATAAIALTMGAGAALAASGGHQQARAAAAAAAVHRHITRAQAAKIAKAKVPHSRVIEIESDDRHDRAVWKVTLATPHGRVIVDVDKRTGKATIVRRGSGGHGDAAGAMALSSHRSGSDSARDAREDRRDDRGDVRREDRRETPCGPARRAARGGPAGARGRRPVTRPTDSTGDPCAGQSREGGHCFPRQCPPFAALAGWRGLSSRRRAGRRWGTGQRP